MKVKQGKNSRGLNNGNIKSNLSKPLFHYLISCSKAVYKGLIMLTDSQQGKIFSDGELVLS